MKTDPMLSSIFEDPRWHQLKTCRRLFFAEIGGQRLGVVLATRSDRYPSFALNCGEMKRLIAGKGSGKLDALYVVAADKNGSGYAYRSHVDAEELNKALANRPTIDGAYGPFWSLDPSEFGLEDKDEPF